MAKLLTGAPTKAEALAALRAKRRSCAIHNLTFLNQELPAGCPPLTPAQLAAVAAVQHRQFLLWWDSWVAPLLDELEATAPDTGVN